MTEVGPTWATVRSVIDDSSNISGMVLSTSDRCIVNGDLTPVSYTHLHALALALSAILRPGDELLSPVGKPYDTLEEVIGIRQSKGSLAEYGITYKQVELLEDGYFDYPAIERALNDRTKLVTIQRSKGCLLYTSRCV